MAHIYFAILIVTPLFPIITKTSNKRRKSLCRVEIKFIFIYPQNYFKKTKMNQNIIDKSLIDEINKNWDSIPVNYDDFIEMYEPLDGDVNSETVEEMTKKV